MSNDSLLQSLQTSSRAHPASYSKRAKGIFPGGKVTGVWSWPPMSI